MDAIQDNILSNLISPLPVDQFMKDVFENEHLLSHGCQLFDHFTVEHFEKLLWSHERLLGDQIDLNKEGKSAYYHKPEAGKDPFRWMMDRYAEGYTLIFSRLDDIDTRLAGSVRPLDIFFKGRTTANGFLTPPGSKGFLPHFDTHDVFIVQLSGTKRWQLYNRELELPLDNQIYLVRQDKLGEPVAAYFLKPGDVLYIPRGMVHGSLTENDHSLHITVGIRPLLGINYIHKLLDTLAEKDVAFRRSIHESFQMENHDDIADLMQKALSATSDPYIQKLTREKVASQLVSQSKPMVGHHLENLENLQNLSLDTKVEKALPQNDALVDSGSKVRLVFAGTGVTDFDNPRPGFLEFSATAYGALNFIRNSHAPFRPADLSGFYSDENKLFIIRELLKEGYLKFA